MPDNGFDPSIDDDVQRRLYRHWLEKRGGRRMPSRQDIDPLELRDVLGDLGLLDVEPGGSGEPQRFRYRLIGTNMVEFFGRDFTGEYVEESKTGEYARKLGELYRDCAAHRVPMYWQGVFEYQNRTHWRVRRLLLPLSTDGETVDMILFSTTFASRDARRLDHPGQSADSILDMHVHSLLMDT